MNVLEKILEEIEEMRDIMKSTVAIDCFGKECENGDCILCVCERAMEMVRSHMDEVENMSGKRLIDANALDDEVMNLFIAIAGNPKQTTVIRECKESFRRMIDEQPTVYVNNGWIPVSERLPEEQGWYQCTCSDKEIWDKDIVRDLYYYPKIKQFVDNIRYECNGLTNVENYYWTKYVIAWQTPTEPYKGE